MPRVSHFYGISIYLHHADHGPPHFHAIYGEFEAQIAIEDGRVLRGFLPRRALGLTVDWSRRYADELHRDWLLARNHQELEDIPPLE